MAHTNESPYTRLTYHADDIFNLTSVKSNYRARAIKLPDGKSLVDVVLTENDRDLFNANLPAVASKVFEPISVLAQGVENGFRVDMVGGSSSEPSIFYLINYNNDVDIYDFYGELLGKTKGFDMNQLNVLDSYVKDALVTMCLIRWYQEIGLLDEANYQMNVLDGIVKDIRTSILYRTASGQAKIPHRNF